MDPNFSKKYNPQLKNYAFKSKINLDINFITDLNDSQNFMYIYENRQKYHYTRKSM